MMPSWGLEQDARGKYTLNGRVVMLLLSVGGDCVKLGKRLDERIQRQQAAGNTQVVAIAKESRADNQPDNGSAQGRAT